MINDSQTAAGRSIKCAKRSLRSRQYPPPPHPPFLLLSSLAVSLFSHCGTNYQLFFLVFFFPFPLSLHIKQPQFGCCEWKPRGSEEYIVPFDGRSRFSQRPQRSSARTRQHTHTRTDTHICLSQSPVQLPLCFLIKPSLLSVAANFMSGASETRTHGVRVPSSSSFSSCGVSHYHQSPRRGEHSVSEFNILTEPNGDWCCSCADRPLKKTKKKVSVTAGETFSFVAAVDEKGTIR